MLNPSDSGVESAGKETITRTATVAADIMFFDDWFDPIDDGVSAKVLGFIETMIAEELDSAPLRQRYGRRTASTPGIRYPMILPE